MKKYKLYIDQNGLVSCRSKIEVDKHIESAKITFNEMDKYIKRSQSHEWTLIPVTPELVHPEVVGSSPEGEEFRHIYLEYDGMTDETVDVEMLTKAFWRYVPNIKTLLSKITKNL